MGLQGLRTSSTHQVIFSTLSFIEVAGVPERVHIEMDKLFMLVLFEVVCVTLCHQPYVSLRSHIMHPNVTSQQAPCSFYFA